VLRSFPVTRDFGRIFEACVALDGGAELSCTLGGQSFSAHAADGTYVLIIDGGLMMEGSAFDIACGFLEACDAKRRDLAAMRKPPSANATSHTRLRALANTPTVPALTPVVIKKSNG
jgi:hypothetical protein